jgi:hypothetical protein
MSDMKAAPDCQQITAATRITLGAALAAALLALVLCPSPAAAQQSSPGAIRGQVLTEGRPVEGALVELAQGGRPAMRRMVTDASGTFQFVGLAAGRYDLLAQHVSYRPATLQGVDVAAGATRTVTITMASELVTLDTLAVTSTTVRVDRRSTEFSTNITEQQIRLLPLGHDPKSIIALTPGARAGHVWGGATNQANNYQIDGLAANHPGVGGDLLQLNVSWIDRIEVKGLGAGAEHGNFQGGLVNMVTKSGTNLREAQFRTSIESHALNASNLEPTEIGSEVQTRQDVEGEVRGPLVRDRLFYYLSGQLIRQDDRFINHLPGHTDRYSPVLSEGIDTKFFGKLTFTPWTRDQIELSIMRNASASDHAGNTGYESPDATWQRESVATLYNAQWQHNWSWGLIEAKASRIALDETRGPHQGTDVPGILTHGIEPPYLAFQNAAIGFRHAPASNSGSIAGTFRARVGGQDQTLKIGAEHSVGTHLDQRFRSGGTTWRPARRPSLDPANTATWRISQSYPMVGVSTGGEVDLQAGVENSALFAQGTLALGNRLVLNPGLRYGRWVGRLTPAGGAGAEFTAVEDNGLDPRFGAILDITGRGDFVVKGHWGRYHQSMIAQFFDRAEGGNIFTDEQFWHYSGPLTPTTTFTAQDRQRLIEEGQLTLQRTVVLNESGPVVDYSQPYVNQWLVGAEKSFGSNIKIEGVYLNRTNHNMVALVDRNAATNYTHFGYVNVLSPDLQFINFEGGRVQFRDYYVPNNSLIEFLREAGRGNCNATEGCFLPPGFVPADTLRLSWDPDYVLTNVPDARREFGQLQFAVNVAQATWGGSVSLVMTALQGDLDSVTGYDDPAGYGAGPYVRVNEGVNAFGNLPNFSPRELKVSVFGNLPWQTQGGIFWTWATGDHFSPQFTITRTGGYRYRTHYGNRDINPALAQHLEGHRIYLGPRGRPQYEARGLMDLRLERSMTLFDRSNWHVTLEMFNIVNMATITRVNTSANRGRNYYHFLGPNRDGLLRSIDPNEYYKAVLERVPPRTLRIGTTVRM